MCQAPCRTSLTARDFSGLAEITPVTAALCTGHELGMTFGRRQKAPYRPLPTFQTLAISVLSEYFDEFTKKHYDKIQGHRQDFTEIEITGIKG